MLVGQAILDEQPAAAIWPALVLRARGRLRLETRTESLAKDMRQVANATVFRGLLALEEGNVDEADIAFRLALALWGDEAAAASGAGLDFNARPIAQACLRWLQ